MHVGETPLGSRVDIKQSNEWLQNVIALLDTAASQLRAEDPVARRTILEATSLLRQQVESPSAATNRDVSGRLLMWQSRKVRDYIDAHITDRLLVPQLGTLVRQSAAHFARSFKRTFGESPHAFVVRRRLEFAARYMLQTDASLSDIALCCGFADQAHLSNTFRRAMGLSPAIWRRTERTSKRTQCGS